MKGSELFFYDLGNSPWVLRNSSLLESISANISTSMISRMALLLNRVGNISDIFAIESRVE